MASSTPPAQFALTERAAHRIAEIAAASSPGKLVIERGGARVVVDPASLDLLAGSELDYTDELMGAHFAVRNPNATSACGCGTSFSVD